MVSSCGGMDGDVSMGGSMEGDGSMCVYTECGLEGDGSMCVECGLEGDRSICVDTECGLDEQMEQKAAIDEKEKSGIQVCI